MISFERSWQSGEVPEAGRKQTSPQSSKRERRRFQGTTGQSASPQPLGKEVEQLLLEAISKHVEEEKLTIRRSQRGSTKGNSSLTNLIAFYDETTGWMDEERALGVVYLGFIKAFDNVKHE